MTCEFEVFAERQRASDGRPVRACAVTDGRTCHDEEGCAGAPAKMPAERRAVNQGPAELVARVSAMPCARASCPGSRPRSRSAVAPSGGYAADAARLRLAPIELTPEDIARARKRAPGLRIVPRVTTDDVAPLVPEIKAMLEAAPTAP